MSISNADCDLTKNPVHHVTHHKIRSIGNKMCTLCHEYSQYKVDIIRTHRYKSTSDVNPIVLLLGLIKITLITCFISRTPTSIPKHGTTA